MRTQEQKLSEAIHEALSEASDRVVHAAVDLVLCDGDDGEEYYREGVE